MNDAVLLLALIITIVSAYLTMQFLKAKLRPQESFGRLILFAFSYLCSIVIWVFLFGLVVFNFKDFLFKQ